MFLILKAMPIINLFPLRYTIYCGFLFFCWFVVGAAVDCIIAANGNVRDAWHALWHKIAEKGSRVWNGLENEWF